MGDRFQYAEVRQKLINALRTDLMGPQSPDEVLDENPMFAYIVGMLYPQTTASADGIDVGEQEDELILPMKMVKTILRVKMMTTNLLRLQSSSNNHLSA